MMNQVESIQTFELIQSFVIRHLYFIIKAASSIIRHKIKSLFEACLHPAEISLFLLKYLSFLSLEKPLLQLEKPLLRLEKPLL